MYDPITIFLIVWGLFCVGLFLLFCFLTGEVPLAFIVKLVWWCWILLISACLENFWLLHQIWKRVLLGRVFLAVDSSLSSLYRAISFWLVEFLLRNQLTALPGVLLYVIGHFSLVVFNILSLSLIFFSFITLYSKCSSLGLTT